MCGFGVQTNSGSVQESRGSAPIVYGHRSLQADISSTKFHLQFLCCEVHSAGLG